MEINQNKPVKIIHHWKPEIGIFFTGKLNPFCPNPFDTSLWSLKSFIKALKIKLNIHFNTTSRIARCLKGSEGSASFCNS